MQSFAQKYITKIMASETLPDASALVYAYEAFVAEKQRKETGIFYTPAYIVDYIVQNTVKSELIQNRGKILDPSCGSGAFLLGAFRHILALGRQENLPIEANKALLEKHIFGIDIDQEATEVAKLVLLLAVLVGKQESIIKQELTNFSPDNFLKNNILCGNALTDFEELDGGFDIVLGNPPWVSLSGRFGNDILNEEAHTYLLQKYRGNTYRPNLYEYFVHRGLDLVKEGGLFSFIVPDRLGFNEQFIPLRKRILENYTMEDLAYKAPFPNIVTDTLIFRFLHKKPQANSTLSVGEFGKFQQDKTQFDYLQSVDFQFVYQINQQNSLILDFIFKNALCMPLGEAFETKVGVIVDTSQVTKERIDANQKVILKGRSIGKYTVGEKFYIDYKKENIKGGTNDARKLGAAEKVLLRKTGIPLFAAYDDSGVFPEQSLYFVFNPKQSISLKYLTALINSKLFNFVYINALVTNKDSTPQIKKIDLDKFPVRLIDLQNAQEKKQYDEIINAVEMIMGLHEKLKTNLTTAQKTQWEKRIVYYENFINDTILDLYDITNPTDRDIILQS